MLESIALLAVTWLIALAPAALVRRIASAPVTPMSAGALSVLSFLITTIAVGAFDFPRITYMAAFLGGFVSYRILARPDGSPV